jgi:hypothetical protein
MFKSIIGLIALSLVIVLAETHVQTALHGLLHLHHSITEGLTEVFSSGKIGNVTRQFFALLVIPFLVGLIPALIYWLIRKHWFPHFMSFVWITWLIQTAVLVVQGQV